MTGSKGLPFFFASLTLLLCYVLTNNFQCALQTGDGVLYFLRTLASFPLIFFVPGAFWFLAFFKRKEIGLLEFLLGNAGVSVALLICLTTLSKLSRMEIGRSSLLVLICISFLSGYAVFLLRGRRPTIVDDLSHRWLSLVSLAAGLTALYICFENYFTWEQDKHWVAVGNPINSIDPAQQLTDWKFPEEGELFDAKVSYRSGVVEIDNRRLEAKDRTVEITVYNEDSMSRSYTLVLFFQSKQPMTLVAYHNGALLEKRRIDRMMDIQCEHLIPRCYRLAWKRRIILAPGENVVHLQIAGPEINDLDLIIDDFSNLTKQQFLSLAAERYLFGEIGEFYDNIEALDFSRHFFKRCFTYTDDLRPGLSGYTIVIPPLGFYLNMFFLALGKNDLHDLQNFYLGKLVILYLVFLLYFEWERRTIAFRFTLIPIFVILAESINLINFRLVLGQDTMLCVWFLLAAYFLLKGNSRLFLLFAAFTCMTRNHGILFVLLTMLSYGVFYGERKRLFRLLGYLFVLATIYIGIVICIGHATGVLKSVWLEDFISENYRFRFAVRRTGTEILERAVIFSAWLAVTSCFQFILIALKKDKLSKYLLFVIALYLPLMLLAKTHKPYYPIMIVYTVSIIGVRSLSQWPAAYFRITVGGKSVIRFDFSKVLYVTMVILGIAAVMFVAISPLIYPAFTTSFPDFYSKIFPMDP